MTRPDTASESRIVLLAKPRGITSFAAIDSVKKAFIKEGFCKKGKRAARLKVGHTGTLDSFADGLLVVLTGKLTRLAPFIEALQKEYLAEIVFGAETDTLDPTGAVVKEAGLPTSDSLLAALPSFIGKIQQVPPEYSALKQGGVRLSDLARAGEEVSPKARPVTVHKIDIESLASPDGAAVPLEDFCADALVAKAVIRVRCSKGTYIRALARDIANKAGSAAHLSALRRLSVGPFLLEEAVGFATLKPFSAFCEDVATAEEPPLPSVEEIRSLAMSFTPQIAKDCGFGELNLKKDAVDAFRSGKPILPQWFEEPPQGEPGSPIAVFSAEGFAGVIHAERSKSAYVFVL